MNTTNATNEKIIGIIDSPVTFNFDELSSMADDKARLDHIRTVLAPYFELVKAKINLIIANTDKKFHKYTVKTIDASEKISMTEFNFVNYSQDDKFCQVFDFDIEVDHCAYFNLCFLPNAVKKWNLCAIESDMGDRETPPSTDLVGLKDSNNFIEIVDALVLSYKNQIDNWIDEELESERYEKMEDEIADLKELNGRSSLPEDIW